MLYSMYLRIIKKMFNLQLYEVKTYTYRQIQGL